MKMKKLSLNKQMNNTILYNGDCLDIMTQLMDNSVDCVVCDLPYGTTNCYWDIIIPFDKLLGTI